MVWVALDSKFTSVQDLAVCLGTKVLSGISELFCKDLRRRRGGFPDLIVWNKVEKKCKVRVEVDKFSRMLKYFEERICNCIEIWAQENFVLFEFFSCPPLCIFS